jgi:hypothetical protein
MAPSVGRAAALVVCACVAVGVAKLPPQATSIRWARLARMEERRNTPELQLVREVSRTSRDLMAAGETLVFLERRDSLAHAAGNADEPQGVVGPNVPDAWRSWFSAQAAQVTREADARGARRAVLAAVFVDTADARTMTREQRRVRRWSNSTILAMDSAAAPFACLAIHDLRNVVGREDRRSLMGPERFTAQTAFGLCRFVATYGIPGPTIHAWLTDGGWRFGQAESAAHPRIFLDPRSVRNLMDYGLYDLSACVQGWTHGCRAWLLDPDLDRPASIRLGTTAFLTNWWGESAFGGLLSDLQAAMGADRFGQFWTSSLPMDSAFTSAFGIDPGTWTRDWLDRQFGPLPRQGPRRGDYAATILLAGLLIAFGAAKAHARNVRS